MQQFALRSRYTRMHRGIFGDKHMTSIFDQDLPRNPANFAPISPLSFIERAADVYPQRLAIIHGDLRRTWSEVYTRCRRLASALASHGIGKGDTVAVMLPNTPAMVEAHFGIPMCGAVLNALNTRLDAETVAFMLDHGEAKARAGRFGIRRRDEGRRSRCARPRARCWSSTSWTRCSRAMRRASARRPTTTSSPAATRRSHGSCRPTSGTRSRSTTPAGPPATPRAWSTTIAARR